MSNKDGATKKDKSAGKEKYLAAPIPEKKEPVKLRRRESTKQTAPPSEPNRKSVVARWFHNLAGAGSQDVKKVKRNVRDGPDGATLDLPEHGVIRSRPETIPEIPASTKILTLSPLHATENRNRWSSYEICHSKERDGTLPSELKPLSSALRSLSDESMQISLDHILNLKQTDLAVNRTEPFLPPSDVKHGARSDSSNSEKNPEIIVNVNGDGEASNFLPAHATGCAESEQAPLDGTGDFSNSGNNSKLESIFAEIKLQDEKISKTLADKTAILRQLFRLNEEEYNHIVATTGEPECEGSINEFLLKSLISADHLTQLINAVWLSPANYAASNQSSKTNDLSRALNPVDEGIGKSDSNARKNPDDQKIRLNGNLQSLQNLTVQLHRWLTQLSKLISLESDGMESRKTKKKKVPTATLR